MRQPLYLFTIAANLVLLLSFWLIVHSKTTENPALTNSDVMFMLVAFLIANMFLFMGFRAHQLSRKDGG